MQASQRVHDAFWQLCMVKRESKSIHQSDRERSGCIKGRSSRENFLFKLLVHSLGTHAVLSLAGSQSSAFKDQLWLLEMLYFLYVDNLWRSLWFFHSSCFWTLPWSNFNEVVFPFPEQACNCSKVGRCIPNMCLPLPSYCLPIVVRVVLVILFLKYQICSY